MGAPYGPNLYKVGLRRTHARRLLNGTEVIERRRKYGHAVDAAVGFGLRSEPPERSDHASKGRSRRPGLEEHFDGLLLRRSKSTPSV